VIKHYLYGGEERRGEQSRAEQSGGEKDYLVSLLPC